MPDAIEPPQTRQFKSTDYPRNRLLHELISEQAKQTPQRIVFEAGDAQLTFAELEAKSNQLARHLAKNGVRAGDLVGLCCERNLDTAIALVGILKAGAGYVPLDPEYPMERLSFMAGDADVKLVLAHASLEELVGSFGKPVIYLDKDRKKFETEPATTLDLPQASAEKLVAYVIYTSGSTGKPKGVLVSHRNAVNLLWGIKSQGFFTPDHVVLGLTTLSFDISVAEMFVPMITGGKVAIIDRKTARDGQLLIRAIGEHQPNFIQATPSTLRFLIEAGWKGEQDSGLRLVSTGEPLPRDLVQPLLDRCDELWNWYGPTETTVWSARHKVTDADDPILIGQPWENTNLYIVDESDELLSVGEEGELLIGGDGVTLGYLNRDGLTQDRFVEFQGEPVYRTGDLARFTKDGLVECLGRIDSQVKLFGHRIELEEIDFVLASQPGVKQAVSCVREDTPGDKRLIGYLIPDASEVDLSAIRRNVEGKLPDYMVPQAFVVLDEFPQTPSGKIDRNALPKPNLKRPELCPFVAPAKARESKLAQIWSDLLSLDRVGVNDNFFEIGGSSILALRAIAAMQTELGIELTAPELFDNPTISQVARYLDRKATSQGQGTSKRVPSPANEFAIVGMAARMPGAENIREFWSNLVAGKESISFFSPEELDSSLPDDVTQDSSYVAARGIVKDADKFDAQFFSITPRESALIDPQQRLMLEVAWSALEDAGCVPEKFDGAIGIWAGSYNNSYFTKNILTNPDIVERTGEFQMGVYSEKDYIATRVAHKLNLNGPAVNVNTACSTSLVAVIEACNSLALGQSDVAIAGGSSVTFPQNCGHTHQEGSIMSPDGHCRPFDSQSAGTLFSDGVGAVVLRRLEDALRDGDRIYAVIKGVGINNDGGEKASFTAPSIQGQAQAVSMAQSQASVPIETIGYIEAHGTATPIGDPIEVQALNSVFQSQTDKKQFCGLGSVKSNVGHTVAAAGVAGLIKTTLALFHEQIPPTLHYEKANPQIDFEASPFFVCDSLKSWPKSDVKRRAGVSSFGVGGTNAHILLEEAPQAKQSCQSSSNGASESETIPVQLLPISAKSASSVEGTAKSMAEFFADGDTRTTLADHAYTLQTARASFQHRAFAVGADFDEVATAFSKKHPPRFAQGQSDGAQREVAFMFPGQGSQYVWMGKNLYDHAPVFRQAMDECCDILTPLLDRDLRSVLYPQDGDDKKAAEILRETRFTQPAIFALGYSLAKLWESWGIHADCYLGHSIGEFVAACMAGVFRLEDGLKMIAERGRLMQSLPGGSMLSVRAEASEVEQYVKGDVAIGSFNGPKLCALAGPDEDIERIRQELDSRDIACKLLHTSHAFHSPMMDQIVEPFQKFVAQFELNSPQKPVMSTVTADWMTNEQATDPGYWAKHMRAPVAFSQAIQQLWATDQSRVLLELGPRTTLSTLAKQHAANKKTQRAFASLSDNANDNAEWYSILAAVGQLWLLGIEHNWPMASSLGATPRKATLPTYCFQRERHFIEPGQLVAPSNPASANLHATLLTPKPLTDQTAKRKTVTTTRRDQITFALTSILEKTSGIEATDFDDDCTFLEMGMDSLVLTQAAAAMKKELGINVSFRQMLETTPTVSSLVDFLDAELPAEKFTDVVEEQTVQQPQAVAELPAAFAGTEFTPATLGQFSGGGGSDVAQAIIQNQLQIMQQQLQVLAGATPSSAPAPVAVGAVQTQAAIAPTIEPKPATSQGEPKKKTFGAGARVSLSSDKLDANQQVTLDKFIEEYVSKTPKSKANAQRHRKYMADPRTVSGFKPPLKEMTYPIVVEKSKGAYLWDIDGNEYVDVTCGFGSNFVGHTADFMVEAMTEQLKLGYEIGPQTILAGEVAKLFCELTGAERCAFANTGSEAVLGATRLARTATGRDLIVMFTGDYHGILDEVIVRGNKNGSGLPAATGIPGSHVENTLILEYGTDESLRIIEERLDEIAAIVVETVQSRRPEYQPKEFLQKLRRLTENEEAALIFDEVITGFRIAAGGAQEYFGVKADLATYGKIVGGGMPIGMVAGKAKYMDGLDGGFWEFGDDSQPEVGMTYFAGTFVRHPVTMAAAKRILEFIRDEKDEIYDRINGLTNRLAREVNDIFTTEKMPLFFAHFGSLFKVQFEQELPYGELLFAALRHRGIHIWDHRPCLLTLAHTEADVDEIIAAFRETVAELKAHGFLPTADACNASGDESSSGDGSTSNICNANAKRGKDKDGKPGWFVPDAANPGQYIQVPAPN